VRQVELALPKSGEARCACGLLLGSWIGRSKLVYERDARAAQGEEAA
jgi:hypothetical protein